MNLLKNKKLLIICLLFFIILFFKPYKVKAFSVTDDNTNFSLEFPDFIKENNLYYVIGFLPDKVNNSTTYNFVNCFLLISETPFKVYDYSKSSNFDTSSNAVHYLVSSQESSAQFYKFYRGSSIDTVQNRLNELTLSNYKTKCDNTTSYQITNNYNNAKISANHTIPISNVSGTDFFLIPPQPTQEVEETQPILQTTTTSMDFSQVMVQILALLPIILLTVTSALALRKAIKLLLTTLAGA